MKHLSWQRSEGKTEELAIQPEIQFQELRLFDFQLRSWSLGQRLKNRILKFRSLRPPWFCIGLLISPDFHLPIYESLPLQLSRELLSLVRNQQLQRSITGTQSLLFQAPILLATSWWHGLQVSSLQLCFQLLAFPGNHLVQKFKEPEAFKPYYQSINDSLSTYLYSVIITCLIAEWLLIVLWLCNYAW